MYRSNCAFCHGLTGLGGRGPNLVAGERLPDADFRKIVRNGVPGSTMPAFGGFATAELDSLALFVRHLAGDTAKRAEKATGDAERGRQVYAKNGCASCHQIDEQGSTYGPELSRIGRSRSLVYLRESIVEPSGDIPQQYEGVTVVTQDGKRVSGVRINEDSFSVQLRLASEEFRSFDKQLTREVVDETKSLMPAYKAMPPAQLEDLVAYLASLRGKAATGRDAEKAKGIQ